MILSQVITKAKSAADLNDIFENNVNVQLGWVNDTVTVERYTGSVTTDFIARCIIARFIVDRGDSQTEDCKRLAKLLAEKVFIPLKNLVESPDNQCSLYQLTALTPISWTPQPAPEFGKSIALKHAMVLGSLDQKYMNW